MSIIISNNNKNAVRIDKSSFKNEDELQAYLASNPDVVPLHEIKEDIKLLVLARELETGSGPIDAVGIDQDGSLYFIETKLYKNADKRKVVAQVLDYGASVWINSTDFSVFMGQLDEGSRRLFGKGARDKAKEFYGYDSDQLEQLFDSVQQNLASANFKFFILMDELEQRLKDLIVFLNQNSQFTVYAVELEFYRHEGMEIAIPRLYGAEVKKDVTSVRDNAKLTIEDFWSQLEQQVSSGKFKYLKDLLQDMISQADGITLGASSIGIRYDKIQGKSLFTVYTNGSASVNFGNIPDDSDKRQLAKLFESELPEIWQQPKFQSAEIFKLYPSLTTDQLAYNSSALKSVFKKFLAK